MDCVCTNRNCAPCNLDAPELAVLGRGRIVTFLPVKNCEKTSDMMGYGYHPSEGFMILKLFEESIGTFKYRGTMMLSLEERSVSTKIKETLKLSLFNFLNI